MASLRPAVLLVLTMALPGVGPGNVSAADPEVELLKEQIRILQKRVEELEKSRAAPAPAVQPPPAVTTAQPKEPPKEVVGKATEVEDRGSMQDQQQAAPRPGALTLDPKYQGFITVPSTPVMIKFNAKPRTDLTIDNRNSGDDNRFVTAKIPVQGDPAKGGGNVFNINAKASQLRIDVRAPDVPGSPRFYYENDFFGSGGGEFPYRLRHLYGQIYNVIVGQTFSIFEDPDVWPDTVDYEGPNSAIFARRAVVRYQHAFDAHWQANIGVEQPDTELDNSGNPDASAVNHAPDGGFNVRWEDKRFGHVQFASIFRAIGVRNSNAGDQTTFGWGGNLSTVLKGPGRDSAQAQLTYGEGLFRYINDDFFNNDAGFDADGDLEAIPYFGGLFGYTHHWDDQFRSTVSYGYAHLDNTAAQPGTAYNFTHYGSANLIWQLRKRLQVGAEGLYGSKESKDGSNGDAFRFQLGLVYSIFD
jgi:hypothetical protein